MNSRHQNVLLFAAASCFLPYILSAVAIVVIAVYIFLMNEKDTQKKILGGVTNLFLYLFTAITMFVAGIYDNWLGMGASLLFLFVLLIMNFSAAVCDKEFFIRLLKVITAMSLTLSFATFTEKLTGLILQNSQRCSAYCLNPNYLAELLMISVLACAYLELSRNAKMLYCYLVAIINIAAMLLSQSIFACISLFVGLAVMLLLMRRHIVFSFMFIFITALFVVIAMNPDLIPRFSEVPSTISNRVMIWNASIDSILNHPVFGRGFLTYHLVSGEPGCLYKGWHSHNLLIEMLLSFGVVGTVIISSYFALFFRRLNKITEMLEDKMSISCFVIALIAAGIVHSLVDLTFLWCQTGLLGAIIIGGGMGVAYSSVKKQKDIR